jgi:spore coat protein U-like protein
MHQRYRLAAMLCGALLSASASATGSGSAEAATASAAMSVSVTITAGCTTRATSPALTNWGARTARAGTARTITVSCTLATPYAVGRDSGPGLSGGPRPPQATFADGAIETVTY